MSFETLELNQIFFCFIPELKCLQIILNDETKSKALEDDCREKLQQRIEMFNNAAVVSVMLVQHFQDVELILVLRISVCK